MPDRPQDTALLKAVELLMGQFSDQILALLEAHARGDVASEAFEERIRELVGAVSPEAVARHPGRLAQARPAAPPPAGSGPESAIAPEPAVPAVPEPAVPVKFPGVPAGEPGGFPEPCAAGLAVEFEPEPAALLPEVSPPPDAAAPGPEFVSAAGAPLPDLAEGVLASSGEEPLPAISLPGEPPAAEAGVAGADRLPGSRTAPAFEPAPEPEPEPECAPEFGFALEPAPAEAGVPEPCLPEFPEPAEPAGPVLPAGPAEPCPGASPEAEPAVLLRDGATGFEPLPEFELEPSPAAAEPPALELVPECTPAPALAFEPEPAFELAPEPEPGLECAPEPGFALEPAPAEGTVPGECSPEFSELAGPAGPAEPGAAAWPAADPAAALILDGVSGYESLEDFEPGPPAPASESSCEPETAPAPASEPAPAPELGLTPAVPASPGPCSPGTPAPAGPASAPPAAPPLAAPTRARRGLARGPAPRPAASPATAATTPAAEAGPATPPSPGPGAPGTPAAPPGQPRKPAAPLRPVRSAGVGNVVVTGRTATEECRGSDRSSLGFGNQMFGKSGAEGPGASRETSFVSRQVRRELKDKGTWKSPGKAALLSAILPGVGDFYVGKVSTGLVFYVIFYVLLVLLILRGDLLLVPALVGLALVSAGVSWTSAQKHNEIIHRMQDAPGLRQATRETTFTYDHSRRRR